MKAEPSFFERISRLDPARLDHVLGSIRTPGEDRAIGAHWPGWRRPGQEEPEGPWRVWLVMAGRGFGKTRTGAEWVRRHAMLHGGARIALVGATAAEARAVMVEGESGLLAASGAERPRWEPALGRLTWPSGARAHLYSAAEPDSLRGPQHDFAWADEIGKWARAEEAWDNLMLGLRLGAFPRAVATTTPRATALLRRLRGEAGVAVTGGRTADNRLLPAAFVAAVTARYGGTRLGRQELDGELIEDVEGALWRRALIERCRGAAPAEFARVVVGIDPPAGAEGTCGIVVCGKDADGGAWVLADASVARTSPAGWAGAAARAAAAWGADRVVAETNQGGDMVKSVLAGADPALPVRPVRARFGKGRRAEPVAALFERGEAKFAGAFPALEDELAGLVAGGRYEGPGRSPDRADAMVWALTELMLTQAAAARVRAL